MKQFINFLVSITSCVCLLKSRLKMIFHWKAKLTTEKRDLSSAKSLQFEERSLDKSFL